MRWRPKAIILVYRILGKKLGGGYTCEEIFRTLRERDFADIEDQGDMPLYRRSKLTDALHENYYVSFKKLKSLQPA